MLYIDFNMEKPFSGSPDVFLFSFDLLLFLLVVLSFLVTSS